MFDSLNDQALRAAHDAARVLYDNHRALGLDVLAVKLDTLALTSPWNWRTGASRSPPPTVRRPPRVTHARLPRGISPRLSREGARWR